MDTATSRGIVRNSSNSSSSSGGARNSWKFRGAGVWKVDGAIGTILWEAKRIALTGFLSSWSSWTFLEASANQQKLLAVTQTSMVKEHMKKINWNRQRFKVVVNRRLRVARFKVSKLTSTFGLVEADVKSWDCICQDPVSHQWLHYPSVWTHNIHVWYVSVF